MKNKEGGLDMNFNQYHLHDLVELEDVFTYFVNLVNSEKAAWASFHKVEEELTALKEELANEKAKSKRKKKNR